MKERFFFAGPLDINQDTLSAIFCPILKTTEYEQQRQRTMNSSFYKKTLH